MELFDRIIDIVDTNIILCLLPMILTLWIINLIFKERFHSRKILNFIGWIIIFYSLTIFIRFLIEVFTEIFIAWNSVVEYEQYAFLNRATGPYWWSYWLMFLSAIILPYTLLFKKLRNKFWYVLIVAFCIKIGFYFERYVIIISSFHRDYLPSSWSKYNFGFMYSTSMFFFQGLFLAVISLFFYNLFIRLKKIVPNGGRYKS